MSSSIANIDPLRFFEYSDIVMKLVQALIPHKIAMRKIISIDKNLYQYVLNVSLREPDILRECRELTAGLIGAEMQISPDQGQFLTFLAKLMNAKTILELGTFTGYSSLCFALALPEKGKLITCDIDSQSTAIATALWKKAGVSQKIELILQPALTSLEQFTEKGWANSIDIAFIDADKRNMVTYYEQCLTLIKPGGLILVDNVLWQGKVIDQVDQSSRTNAIREFNEYTHKDSRVEISLLTVGDGLFLARKC